MSLGINQTVDFAFKQMLGNPEHPAVTLHFLNAVLCTGPRICEVTILNPLLEKESEADKLAVLDILAKDEFGRLLNIEMQTTLPAGLSQRLAYYVSSLYVDQMLEGERYTQLRPAISICVLESPLFPRDCRMHLDFRLRESTGQLLTDDLQIHLIELSKSQATRHNIERAEALEQWAFFLRNAEKLEFGQMRQILTGAEFEEAMGVLEMISRTPEQRMLYNARLKFLRDEAARMEFACETAMQEGRQKGLDEGRETGRQEGLQEGRQEGLQEGRQEGLQEGRQEGVLIGQIQLLEQLLSLPKSTNEQLATMDLAQLSARVLELQSRLPPRN